MRRVLLFSVVFLGLVGFAGARPVGAEPDVRLDPVRTWNELALDAVRTTRSSDADAARSYAMVDVAMYDAVNGIASRQTPRKRAHALRSPAGAPLHGSPTAAAVTAGHTVLAGLYPDLRSRFDRQRDADLAALGSDSPGVLAGAAWGRTVGSFVLANRADDGHRPVESQPGSDEPGRFAGTWSGVQYRNLRPFAIADGSAYVADRPPTLASLDYAAAFAEVALVGDRDIPAADKLALYQYWSLGTGSVQPPGEWIRIGLAVADRRVRSLHDRTRLFALLSMALADASIPTVGTKFRHRHWRPEAAIQRADVDGNPYTQANPDWRARAGSPGGTPEYVSGHSSFSAAGAEVLAGFFCADRVEFAHVSDTAPIDPETGEPMRRAFDGFSAAAADAGRSRVVGGTHFEFSNRAGLAMGRAVASEVLDRSLLYTKGPTHFGRCPL